MKPAAVHARRRLRGQSLIEGMMASVVLLIGLIGVLQGVAVASQQNSIANRMTRGEELARQISAAIQAQGFERLNSSTGVLGNGLCTGSTFTSSDMIAMGLSGYPTCSTGDLSAVGMGPSPAVLTLLPSLRPQDLSTYKVWLLSFGDGNNPPKFLRVAVVVSWRFAGQPRYYTQFVGLYNPAVTKTKEL